MSVERWSLWRYVTTPDTNLTTLKPSSLAEPRNQKFTSGVITVRGWERIMVMGFGAGAGAGTETFDARIFGWMDNGPGYFMGQIANVVSATQVTGEAILPRNARNASPVLPTSWYPVKTFTLTSDHVDFGKTVANLEKLGLVTEAPNAVYEQAALIIPTLGFKHLQLELFDFDGGGETTDAGWIWRGLEATKLGAAR